MKRFLAIVGREWRAYFLSPLGYVILAAFMFLNGIIFSRIVSYLSSPSAFRQPPLQLVFTNFFFWLFLLVFVPAITMPLLAEERKSGTIETLLTAPVSEGTVVLGKFFGALGFYVVLWLPTVFFVWFLWSRAGTDLGPAFAAYLGILLLGAYFLSVGTFASSLTKSQIVAFVLGIAMLVPIFAAGLLESESNAVVRSLVGYFNLWDHMDEFSKGIIDSRRVVYYLSGTAFFLFLSIVSISAKKETP